MRWIRMILTLKILGGVTIPKHVFFIFFTVFTKNMVRNLLTFTFFTFLQEITKKKLKKILVGGSLRWICRPMITKNRKLKIHILKKMSTKKILFEKNEIYFIQGHVRMHTAKRKKSITKFCLKKTKYISFRAMSGCILPKEKILKSKLAAGEQIS